MTDEPRLISRYIVVRSTTISRRPRDQRTVREYSLAFIAPLAPILESSPPEEENDPVADLLWETEMDATPHDFVFENEKTEHGDSGIELSLDHPLEVGAIIDIEIRVVGKRAELA